MTIPSSCLTNCYDLSHSGAGVWGVLGVSFVSDHTASVFAKTFDQVQIYTLDFATQGGKSTSYALYPSFGIRLYPYMFYDSEPHL